MSEEDPARASGSVPNAWGNALGWRWTREMPRTCKGPFLTMLYALRAIAAPTGELAFSRDQQPIRIQDIAKAAGCSEKDARRYLDAAILAGVVAVRGERRRGAVTLYVLVLSPFPPDWQAAADHLRATARGTGKTWPTDPKKTTPGSGHCDPNPEIGSQCTEPEPEEPEPDRVTVTGTGSGHCDPTGSVHSDPNNPGGTHGVPHEVVDVVPQPPDRAGAREQTQSPQQRIRRCERCGQPIIRATRRLCHGCQLLADGAHEDRQAPVQGAFLLPLPAGPTPAAPASPRASPAPSSGPERVCGCGRTYRAPTPSPCPDCQHAAAWAEAANT